MPNKTKRYKRDGASTGRAHVRTSRKGDSVKALLSRTNGVTLARVSEQATQQKKWRLWLESHLPNAAATHLSGVVERGDTLVIFTESAAWSARMRYAVAEIEPLIKKERLEIRRIEVRVMPRN